ncbi:Glucan 1,3-beta-glucosidase [Bertholletia excelsa]
MTAYKIKNAPVRAANLGGWLVTEGWIKPSLFDGIPNKDFLDGTGLQFKSAAVGKYISAESGGGSIVLWRLNSTHFQLRVFNKQFLRLSTAGDRNRLAAKSETAGEAETFEIVRGEGKRVESEAVVRANSNGTGDWGNGDPSVFVFDITDQLRGEYQVTNGYGDRAPLVMKVRIPVGWWIASDQSPPKPYVGGSLQALDNAFTWAEKHGVKVIIDLHAAPGSQNGNDHSSSRDGSQEWGKSEDNIQQTVHVIDFLTERYASRQSLYAVELLNEPLAPGVSLESLTKFYNAGYKAVRKYTSKAYVVMSNRLGPADSTELLSLASSLQRTVIDVHYYNLFSNKFKTMTVQQNIDYINKNRLAQLNKITTLNGPLTFVGEWTGEWSVQGASEQDYKMYAQAQLQVYGRATFGWAYWTFKIKNNHWSLKWMIENGYIKL